MKWMKRHKGIVITVMLIAALGTTGVIVYPKLTKAKKQTPTQTRQNTVELTKMDLTTSVSATGTIESAKTKTVSASISNVEVKNVKVEEGDAVKKGDTLVTFDKTDLKEALSEAKENLADAKSEASDNLESAEKKLSEAKSNYTKQKEKMAATVASAKKTYENAKKAVSAAKTAEEKQKAKEAVSTAKSAYEKAKEEQENTNSQNKSSIEEAESSLKSTKKNNEKSVKEAQKSVDEAEEALENCSVTAPFDGTVTAVGVEAGDTYSGGEMFEISDCSDLQVSTSVTEYDIASVKKGQRVVILTDATGDTELEGEITYVAVTTGSSLSSGSSGSGSGSNSSGMSSGSSSSSGYEVTVKIKDKNDALRVGMTAKCSIILEEVDDVYAVPYDAIQTDSDGNNVIYVMNQETRQKQEIAVTKGMESDYYVEVSGDGLSEGLKVIIPTDEKSTSEDSSDSDSSALSGLFGGSRGGSGMPGGNSDGGSHGGPGGNGGMGGGPGK